MCGAEYGGGGGERRYLRFNQLTGPLPVELSNLDNLVELCGPPPLTLQCGVSCPLDGWVGRFTGAAG